ncbi:MAG: hypothetical protein COA99_14525 [Moraxellaceae bacterium]|nr:MAG: hypothetical protein COA99_14525 [Moraxellaceae bacterium]
MLTKICLPLFLFCSTLCSNAYAAAFDDFSLEQLLEIETSIASVGNEAIPKAPAIVSRYNLKDIQKMGISKLEDLLSLIPGVLVKQGVGGYPIVIIRGITQFNNQKVLFLLDDVPYWDSENGNFPIRGIPMEAIDHVEVIRGPGAIFYGTNATTGVIKITTKKENSSVVTGSVGSNGQRNVSAYIEHSFNENIRLHISGEFRREDGYHGQLNNTLVFDQFRFVAEDLLGESPAIPSSGSIPVVDEGDSFWLKFQFHSINVIAHYFENNYQQIGGILAPFTLSEAKYIGKLLHFDYEWSNDNISTQIFTDYSHFEDYQEDIHSFGQNITFFGGGSSGTSIFEMDNPSDAFRWRAGGTLNYQINDQLSIFGGAEYEHRAAADNIIRVKNMPKSASDFLASIGFPDLASEPFSAIHYGSVIENSLYTQLDYQLTHWRFLIGARHTDNENWGETTTPRIATVYTIDDKQSLKLLYSVGFNTPSLNQTDVSDTGANVANPNLKTEEIKTTDLAYTYSDGNSLFVVNLYYFETDDLVQNVFAKSTPDDININLNLDVKRWGLELDYQYAQVEWKVFSNFSYHHQGNRDDHSENIVYSSVADFTEQIGDFTAAVIPRYTAMLGGFYSPTINHDIGASIRYIGDMKGADAVRLLNINYSFKVHDQNNRTLEFYTQITNALDEDIVHPDDSIPPIELPGGDGRGWAAGMKLYF